MSIDGRLNAISLPERQRFSFEAFMEDLLARCRASMLELTSDAERDVVSFATEVLGDYYDIRGLAAAGHVRLLLSIRELDATIIEATVLAAKGEIEVDAEALGRSGTLFGNRVHVTRGFDVLLETAMEHGVRRIVGSPVDDRVRALYVVMGFVRGEVLDLDDARSIERAVTWIDTQYDSCEDRFPGFERPW